MKRYALTLAGIAFLAGSFAFADDMKMEKTAMKHEATMCEKHCNLKELEKTVDALKARAASESKMVSKDHLKKDIETYEKKLTELKAELDEMK